ncbi:MAG TPA: hypothetical protein VH934_15455 [Xanthobacteraceae bacterium]|jgi:hypothetical protein
MPLLICILLLVAHAGLYLAILRDWPALASERGIFRYHFLSALVVAVGFGVWALAYGGADTWAWFACAVMLHGIYSLSFLELWALADDSYSLAILEIVHRGDRAAGPALMRRLEAIGASKQGSRLDALRSLGLVREPDDGSFALTPAGHAAALLARALLVLVNVREYG